MPDTKLPRPEDDEAGVFGATLVAGNVTSIAVTPVPAKAPGIIVAEPGTVKEEHIFYRKRDAGAGTITGLIRDLTNLNGGVGQEHTNGEDWETLQAARYILNILDTLQDGYQEEMQVVAKVDADTFTVDTNRAAYYTKGRVIRFNYDDTKLAIVLSSSYNAGTGLTTVEIVYGAVPTLTNVELGNQAKAFTNTQPIFYVAETGAADAHVITLSPVPSALYAGLRVAYLAANANTTAVTLNTNGLGAVAIKKNHDQALVSGDIEAGQLVEVQYDGTVWQLISPTAASFVGQNSTELFAADAGSTDAYAITLAPAVAAYVNGQVFRFKANTVNTGAATLAVNGLTAKTIKKNYNSDLANADIAAGQYVEVIYDSVQDVFQLLSPVANVASGVSATTAKFHATQTAGQTITNATPTKINWGNELYDPGSNFDIATNDRFTAPVTGYYQFNTAIHMVGNTTDLHVYFSVNGSSNYMGERGGAPTGVVHGSQILLGAGDYIEVFIYHANGGNRDTSPVYNNPSFSGHLIST